MIITDLARSYLPTIPPQDDPVHIVSEKSHHDIINTTFEVVSNDEQQPAKATPKLVIKNLNIQGWKNELRNVKWEEITESGDPSHAIGQVVQTINESGASPCCSLGTCGSWSPL